MQNSSSTFDSDSGKSAGIKSGIARNLKRPSKIVEDVLADLLFARELIAECLKADLCKHCSRTGPKALRDITELTKQLSDLSDQVLNRYRGRPSVESNLERHASVGDYVNALKEQSTLLDEMDFTGDIPSSFADVIDDTQDKP